MWTDHVFILLMNLVPALGLTAVGICLMSLLTKNFGGVGSTLKRHRTRYLVALIPLAIFLSLFLFANVRKTIGPDSLPMSEDAFKIFVPALIFSGLFSILGLIQLAIFSLWNFVKR